MQANMKTAPKQLSTVKLQAGGGIRFGFMRQNNLSGRTLSVTDVVSYVFGEDCFASYQIRDEETEIAIILVEEENPEDSYMALSFPLKEKWTQGLFAKIAPKQWFSLDEGDEVPASLQDAVMPQGWVVASYSHVMSTKGKKLGGDFRHRSQADRNNTPGEPFEYALLMSESGEYALEAEKYANGKIRVFATVYRPVSDITDSNFMRPYIVTDNSKEHVAAKPVESKPVETEAKVEAKAAPQKHTKFEEALKEEALREEGVEEETPELEEEEQAEAVVIDKVIAEDAQEILPPVNLATSKTTALQADEATFEEATGKGAAVETAEIVADAEPVDAIATATMQSPKAGSELLSCNAQLALRLLDEAQRNKLSLSDIIRKVIDLPKESEDVVYIPFELSESEKEKLAKRYGKTDTTQITESILQELKDFAGV